MDGQTRPLDGQTVAIEKGVRKGREEEGQEGQASKGQHSSAYTRMMLLMLRSAEATHIEKKIGYVYIYLILLHYDFLPGPRGRLHWVVKLRRRITKDNKKLQ